MQNLLQAIIDNLTIPLGNFVIIDLIAATVNAFNSALLARHPSHYRNYTLVGILLLASAGGIAGGVTRDIILNQVPAALTNPWFLILCILAAGLALRIRYSSGQHFRQGMLQFMTAFSLPWFAAAGADKALDAQLPVIGALAVGVIGATAGRFVLDLCSGVTPQHFVKGEWFVGAAVLSSLTFIVLYYVGLTIWPATLIAVVIGFGFRILALNRGWEEPEPYHEDGQAGATPPPPATAEADAPLADAAAR